MVQITTQTTPPTIGVKWCLSLSLSLIGIALAELGERRFGMFHVFSFRFIDSINKESIVDLHANVIRVSSKIESCTEQNLELSVLEIFVVSASKAQLALQIEDASRPEKNDVSAWPAV